MWSEHLRTASLSDNVLNNTIYRVAFWYPEAGLLKDPALQDVRMKALC